MRAYLLEGSRDAALCAAAIFISWRPRAPGPDQAARVSAAPPQVMAREMFNPNFSLFVPMPAGAPTFQPNPNSTVQNDEARAGHLPGLETCSSVHSLCYVCIMSAWCTHTGMRPMCCTISPKSLDFKPPKKPYMGLPVQARGTNHLDFFRFVGRVVGKALHDGQFVDAYFTRSFYKHCLGQPLTYQARAHSMPLPNILHHRGSLFP